MLDVGCTEGLAFRARCFGVWGSGICAAVYRHERLCRSHEVSDAGLRGTGLKKLCMKSLGPRVLLMLHKQPN